MPILLLCFWKWSPLLSFIDSALFHPGKHGALDSAVREDNDHTEIKCLSPRHFLQNCGTTARHARHSPSHTPTYLWCPSASADHPAKTQAASSGAWGSPWNRAGRESSALWGHQAHTTRRWKAVEMLCWEVHHWSGPGPSGLLYFESIKNSCPTDQTLCPQQTPSDFSQTCTWFNIFLCGMETGCLGSIPLLPSCLATEAERTGAEWRAPPWLRDRGSGTGGQKGPLCQEPGLSSQGAGGSMPLTKSTCCLNTVLGGCITCHNGCI